MENINGTSSRSRDSEILKVRPTNFKLENKGGAKTPFNRFPL